MNKRMIGLFGFLALGATTLFGGGTALADGDRIETCGDTYSVQQDGDCNVRQTKDPTKVEIIGLTAAQKALKKYDGMGSDWPTLRTVTLPGPFKAGVDQFNGTVKLFWK
jgi:hypothetical protein